MLKTHKISEHQTLSWDKFSCPQQAQKALTLLAEKSNFKPFSYTPNGIKALHHVGVISLGGQIVEVLPKVFSDSEDHKANITGLMYLLKLSQKLNISETDMARLSQQFDSLLEVFIYFFAHELFELLNNDFKACYVQQTENLNFVKGRIDFTHHIRHNHTNQAKFYCNYDEYDSNILLNQILKATVHKCLSATKSHFALLRRCDHLLAGVDRKRFTNPNICKQVKFTRLNQNYHHVFELAKLLLFGNSPHLSSHDLNTFSIMFDMNKLFEEAIYQVLEHNKNSWSIREVKAQSPQKKMFDDKSDNFTMKPDIYIELVNGSKVIIDAKYKRLDAIKPAQNSKQKGVSQADIYQLFAYSQYYQAQQCVLLYPQFDHKIEPTTLKNNDPKDINLRNNDPTFQLGVDFIDLKLVGGDYNGYIEHLTKEISEILNNLTTKASEDNDGHH